MKKYQKEQIGKYQDLKRDSNPNFIMAWICVAIVWLAILGFLFYVSHLN